MIKQEIRKINIILSIVAGNTLAIPEDLMESETFKEMLYSMLLKNNSIDYIAKKLTDFANKELC